MSINGQICDDSPKKVDDTRLGVFGWMKRINLIIGTVMSLEKDMGIKIDTCVIKEGMSQLNSILSWTFRISKGKCSTTIFGLVEHGGAVL